MADPITNRAVKKPYRSDQGSDRSPFLSSRYTRRSAGAQASDGPVDAWVDDVDSDWDDIVVPEHLPADFLPAGTTPGTVPVDLPVDSPVRTAPAASPDRMPARLVPEETPGTGAPAAEASAP